MPIQILPGWDVGDLARVNRDSAVRAARALVLGGLVGLPTETVYGLAADASNERAVRRVFAVKGRPPDHPLIVHLSSAKSLNGWSAEPNPMAEALARRLWPGPVTLVVRASKRVSPLITGGQPTVAVRSPAHPVALACLRAMAAITGDADCGVAAPSANRFGRVSPTSAADVLAELESQLDSSRDLVLDGGTAAVGVESTIVDCTGPHPRVLRLGAIGLQQIEEVLAGGGRRAGVTSQVNTSAGLEGIDAAAAASRPDSPRVPGALDSHYSPSAQVVLVEPGEPLELRDSAGRSAAQAVLTSQASPPVPEASWQQAAGPSHPRVGLLAQAEVPTPPGWFRLASPRDPSEYARVLYASLREADRLGLAQVVAVVPGIHASPLAAAVRDRLSRAAHSDPIQHLPDSRGR